MHTTVDLWDIIPSQRWSVASFPEPREWNTLFTSSITATEPTGMSLGSETLRYPGNMETSYSMGSRRYTGRVCQHRSMSECREQDLPCFPLPTAMITPCSILEM